MDNRTYQNLQRVRFKLLPIGKLFYQQDLSGRLLRDEVGEVLIFVKLRSREAQRVDRKAPAFGVSLVDTPVLVANLVRTALCQDCGANVRNSTSTRDIIHENDCARVNGRVKF